jgi:hypothetical protein
MSPHNVGLYFSNAAWNCKVKINTDSLRHIDEARIVDNLMIISGLEQNKLDYIDKYSYVINRYTYLFNRRTFEVVSFEKNCTEINRFLDKGIQPSPMMIENTVKTKSNILVYDQNIIDLHNMHRPGGIIISFLLRCDFISPTTSPDETEKYFSTW